MTEFVAGGRRRIDRVLAPGYLDGIESLDLEEVRIRRAEADQEEVDLSYARRLLQGPIRTAGLDIVGQHSIIQRWRRFMSVTFFVILSSSSVAISPGFF